MKKMFLLLALLFALVFAAPIESHAAGILYTTSNPSGNACAGYDYALNTTTGILYYCKAGVFAQMPTSATSTSNFVLYPTSSPSGNACSVNGSGQDPEAQVFAGVVYTCQAGTYQAAGGGGGGGGNVSNSGTPTAAQAALWVDTTHIKGVTVSQDGTLSSTGVLTVTKTNNVSFGFFATGTDAANLTGTLNIARFPSWTNHAIPFGTGAAGAPSFLTSPVTNGLALCGFNVTASAAVDPTCSLSGVPVNAQSGNYTILYSDRAAYIKYSGGTTATLTLPQVTGTTASNLPFVVQNLNSGNLTITANAADKIDNGSTGGSTTLLPNWIAFVYQDSSSAPGNWWTAKIQNFAAHGSTGALCSWSTTTGAFTCGDLTGDATTSGTKAVTVSKINGTSFAGTNGNFVSFGASNTPADSAKAVPSGAVVGTTDTQTLSGKTLSGVKLGVTTVTTTPYTILATDSYIVCDTATAAAPLTLVLPAATGTGRTITVVSTADSTTNLCTVSRTGSDTIGRWASLSWVLGSNFQTITLLDRASGVWDLPRIQPSTIYFGCSGTATASSNVRMFPSSTLTTCTAVGVPTSTITGLQLNYAGAMSDLEVYCNAVGVNASSGVFTVYDAGTATALVSGAVGTGRTASDTTHLVNLNFNSRIQIAFTTQASETLGSCTASLNLWR